MCSSKPLFHIRIHQIQPSIHLFWFYVFFILKQKIWPYFFLCIKHLRNDCFVLQFIGIKLISGLISIYRVNSHVIDTVLICIHKIHSNRYPFLLSHSSVILFFNPIDIRDVNFCSLTCSSTFSYICGYSIFLP